MWCASAPRHIASHLFQLVALLIETRERLKCLLTLLKIAKPSVDSREDVIVGRRAWVQNDSVIHRICGSLKLPLTLLGSSLLKPGGIGLRIELESFLRVLEGLYWISGAVVVRAQVHVGRDKLSVALLVEGDCFLISLKRAGVIP